MTKIFAGVWTIAAVVFPEFFTADLAARMRNLSAIERRICSLATEALVTGRDFVVGSLASWTSPG